MVSGAGASDAAGSAAAGCSAFLGRPRLVFGLSAAAGACSAGAASAGAALASASLAGAALVLAFLPAGLGASSGLVSGAGFTASGAALEAAGDSFLGRPLLAFGLSGTGLRDLLGLGVQDGEGEGLHVHFLYILYSMLGSDRFKLLSGHGTQFKQSVWHYFDFVG